MHSVLFLEFATYSADFTYAPVLRLYSHKCITSTLITAPSQAMNLQGQLFVWNIAKIKAEQAFVRVDCLV